MDLSCNHIGFRGLCYLLDAAKSKLNKLKHLELFACGLDDDFKPKMKYKHLKLTELQYLNLSHNNLCVQKAQANSSSNGSLKTFLHPDFGLVQDRLETLHLVNIEVKTPQDQK